MEQEYNKYTTEDHYIWSLLYKRMMEILPDYSSKEYIEGIDRVGFKSDKIPDFVQNNINLRAITGWSIYAVPGLVDNFSFFKHLNQKEFPAATWIRKKEVLEYLEEPDLFHDVFGHVPLLANTYFAKFLEELSAIALEYIDNEWAIELISRLYWYTVEFGLIKENNKLKVYGAGILSSIGETKYSIDSEIPKRLPFDIKNIFDTPYIKDKFQEQYFIIDSYEQLYTSISDIKNILEKELICQVKI